MHRVIWSGEAIADLDAIRRFLLPLNRQAALRLADRIIEAAARLSDFPKRGRLVVEDVHQLSAIYPYLIRYSVEEDSVTIVSVRHGARDES